MRQIFTKKNILKEIQKKSFESNKDAIQYAKEIKKDRDEYKSFNEKYGDISQKSFHFLDLIRESGFINMFQAVDFLWSGPDFIRKWTDLHNPNLRENELYDDIVKESEYVRNLIINKAVELCDDNIEISKVNMMVKKVSREILEKWMVYHGTQRGRKTIERDVDESSRTLSKSRKKRLYPKTAKKYNPLRFKPSDRLSESVSDKCTCRNCGHEWKIDPNDKDPKLCHMCGYNNETREFELDKLMRY